MRFIPASIASSKGRSFGGFYAFGFFLWLPALIVSIVIEDKDERSREMASVANQVLASTQNQLAENQAESQRKKEMKPVATLYARNCHPSLPLRPMKAELSANEEGNAVCTLFFKAYGEVPLDQLVVELVLYGVFDNVLYEGERVFKLTSAAGTSFYCVSPLTGVLESDLRDAKYCDAYVKAVSQGEEITKYTAKEKIARPLEWKELEPFKRLYGYDAFTPFVLEEDGRCAVCAVKKTTPAIPAACVAAQRKTLPAAKAA